MGKMKKRDPKEYQTTLRMAEFFGRNTHGEHSALMPGEFLDIVDYEVYPRYLETRRGSQFIIPETIPYPYPSEDPDTEDPIRIEEKVVWDVGTNEYLITQVGKYLYNQLILTVPQNPVRINDFDDELTDLTTEDRADMFVQGDRVYVYHPSGNKVIEYIDSVMKVRDMGMDKPVLLDIDQTTNYNEPGQITGKYTYGIEKVYQKDGYDVLASSPNRKYVATHATQARETNAYGTVHETKMRIYVNPDELEDDDLWTALRLWRSKNQNIEYATPNEPIDAQGVPNELYEVALITKEEIENAGVAAIATSTNNTLPEGNKDVRAGVDDGDLGNLHIGDYCIEDNCTDNELIELIAEEDIELIPIAACKTGTFHADRIYVSGIADSAFADGSSVKEEDKQKVFYTSDTADKYRELFSTTFKVKGIQTDGQLTMKLISFEKDLIVLKESKTMRLPDGNVELDIETTDQRTGISAKTLAEFIPEVGIVAITNDYGDFKIYGFDHIWTGMFAGRNIAIENRLDTAAMQADPDYVSFIYINGKLMISDGTGVFHVLNVEAGRGWSRFSYPMNGTADIAFTFANGKRASVVSSGGFLIEIEVKDTDTDASVVAGTDGHTIVPLYITWKFQSQDGADVLEHEWLSIMATPSGSITVTPFCNDLAWPSVSVEKQTNVNVDANVEIYEALKDREYRLFLEPQTIGTFDFCPMIGNFLHYKVETTAPAIIKVHKLFCVIDEDGIGYSQFDPFQTYGPGSTAPTWLTNIIRETGTAAIQIQESGSQPDVIQEV